MAANSTAKPNAKQMQQAIQGLNQMRNEQRMISQKLIEFETDLNEHRLVVDALKAVDAERKCFRMVGGILIEQQVKDVLPDLTDNMDLLKNTMEKFNTKMSEKSNQISEYIKTHNLAPLIRRQNTGPEAKSTDGGEKAPESGTSSVLV